MLLTPLFPTWDVVQDIETNALIAGGATPNNALQWVQEGIDDAKTKGYTIKNIPWGKRNE